MTRPPSPYTWSDWCLSICLTVHSTTRNMAVLTRLSLKLVSSAETTPRRILQWGKSTTNKSCITNECFIKRHSSTFNASQICQVTKTSNKNWSSFRGVVGCYKPRDYSTEGPSQVTIDATPKDCLHDVPSRIEITRLLPRQQITVKMEMEDENQIVYNAFAHYTSDDNGVVNLETDPSTGGSYTGVFPQGLFSSLKPASGMKPFARMMKQDVYTPCKHNVTVHEGTHDVDDVGPTIATIVLQRFYIIPGVKRIPVNEGKLLGTLFLPPGPGPFPAVLDLWGGLGGLTEFRAAITAARGIASYAVPYFRYKDLPKGPEEIEDANFVSEAVDFLLKRPEVIPDRCGIISQCLGSTFGLAAAMFDERIKAVAGINPVCFGFGVTVKYNGKLLMKKMDPHYYTMDFHEDKYLKFNEEIYKSKYLNVKSEYLFPMELCPKDTHIMLSAGTDDTYYSDYGMDSVKERANMVGNFNVEAIKYKNAGHILEVPFGPFIPFSYQPYYPYREGGPPTIRDTKGVMMMWGGSIVDNSNAQVDWWERTLTFINKHIRDNSPWYQSYISK